MEHAPRSLESQKKRKSSSPENVLKKTPWRRNRHNKLRKNFLVPLKLPFDVSARGDASPVMAKIKNFASIKQELHPQADLSGFGSPKNLDRNLKTSKKLSNNFSFKEGEFLRAKRLNDELKTRGVCSSPVFKFEAPGTLSSLSLAKQNARRLMRINFRQPLSGNFLPPTGSKHNDLLCAKKVSIQPQIHEVRYLKSCSSKCQEVQTTSSITATSVNVTQHIDNNKSTFSKTLIQFISASNLVLHPSEYSRSNCNQYNQENQNETTQNMSKDCSMDSRVNPSSSSSSPSTTKLSQQLNKKAIGFSKPQTNTTGAFDLPSSDDSANSLLSLNQNHSSNCNQTMTEFSKELFRCLNPSKVNQNYRQNPTPKTPNQSVLEKDTQPGPSHTSPFNFLEKRIQEVKHNSPTNSPAKALIELLGDRSHIAEILNKTILKEKVDPRFRSTKEAPKKEICQKASEEMLKPLVFQQDTKPNNKFITSAKIYSKEDDFACAIPCKSDVSCEHGEKKLCESSTNVFEILKRPSYSTDLISIQSNVKFTDSLPNIGKHISRIEKNFWEIEKAVDNIKKDFADLAFQQNLSVLINDSKEKRFDDLFKTFSDLKYFSYDSQSPHEVKPHTIYQCINGGLAISVILFVWFMCGDMINIAF